MLSTCGYGRSGRSRKLGVGAAPVGWPDNISWTGFSGSTRSKLTVHEITEIIVAMLETNGIDPNTHVIGSDVPIVDDPDETVKLDEMKK